MLTAGDGAAAGAGAATGVGGASAYTQSVRELPQGVVVVWLLVCLQAPTRTSLPVTVKSLVESSTGSDCLTNAPRPCDFASPIFFTTSPRTRDCSCFTFSTVSTVNPSEMPLMPRRDEVAW